MAYHDALQDDVVATELLAVQEQVELVESTVNVAEISELEGVLENVLWCDIAHALLYSRLCST